MSIRNKKIRWTLTTSERLLRCDAIHLHLCLETTSNFNSYARLFVLIRGQPSSGLATRASSLRLLDQLAHEGIFGKELKLSLHRPQGFGVFLHRNVAQCQ